ncbi:MAG: hypothetical protein H8K07_14755 [Nitrospira sp.]|nr:hypothetical protein [Nitrospira sp.]
MAKRPKKRLVTNADLERMGVKSEDLTGLQLVQLMEGKPIEWPIDPDLPTPTKKPVAAGLKGMIKDMIIELPLVAFGSLSLASALILTLQVLVYLKTGDWPDWFLFTAFKDFLPASFLQWLRDPQDWFGVHKMVFYLFMEIPLALSVFLFAILLAIVFGSLVILF